MSLHKLMVIKMFHCRINLFFRHRKTIVVFVEAFG